MRCTTQLTTENNDGDGDVFNRAVTARERTSMAHRLDFQASSEAPVTCHDQISLRWRERSFHVSFFATNAPRAAIPWRSPNITPGQYVPICLMYNYYCSEVPCSRHCPHGPCTTTRSRCLYDPVAPQHVLRLSVCLPLLPLTHDSSTILNHSYRPRSLAPIEEAVSSGPNLPQPSPQHR